MYGVSPAELMQTAGGGSSAESEGEDDSEGADDDDMYGQEDLEEDAERCFAVPSAYLYDSLGFSIRVAARW